MRWPLLLIALAALLAWAGTELEALGEAPAAPLRSEVSSQAPAPAANADGARVRETGDVAASEGPRVRDAAGAAPTFGPPLFRSATAPPTPGEVQPGQSFRLVGLAGRSEARVAFLRDEADGRAFTARIGESVRDWVVESADERCVALRKARQRQNICLS